MKVIISHDIDHLSVWEHYKDLIVPKAIIRNTIELSKGFITSGEYWGRLGDIFRNKWQRIDELMVYDRDHKIPSTFFVGVSNGRGLSYPRRHAAMWIERIIEGGFDVGVHGIEYLEPEGIRREYTRFKDYSKLAGFGIRMHYLKYQDITFKLLDETGYIFDSSILEMSDPYLIGNLWEFPLHIMDGTLICGTKRWQSQTAENIRKNTISIIREAEKKKLNYFNILFHDRYFTPSYHTWYKWYSWLIEWLQNEGYEFTSFRAAIDELTIS